MRYVHLALALATLTLSAAPHAQEADTLTAEDGWVRDVTASLSATQAAFRDWQEGGVNALAAAGQVDGAFDRLAGRVRLHHDARAVFGIVQQDTLPVRKADDQIRYAFSAELRTGRLLRPSVAFSARSQLAPGYDVSPDSADYPTLVVVPGRALRVSAFAAPALLTQSVGATIRPVEGIVARAGVGLKETVVGIARLRPLYGNRPDQAVRLQAGLDAELRVDRPVAQNVRARALATAFQAIDQIGGVAPDLRGELSLLLRVNPWLQVTVDGAALYDADILERVQLRQSLAVGLVLDVL